MRLFNKISVISSLLILGGCAYAVESSNQDITFMTPGAENAKCYVMVDKLKYQVYPPQTINIKKHDGDMLITCHAPGNRTVEMVVEPEFSKRAIWGTPAGMAWDYASQSLFYYPSVIAVDFSQEMLKANKLPAHNNSDIRQPESYDLEEFLPADPKLNSDKDKIKTPLMHRDDPMSDTTAEQINIEDRGYNENIGGKGDLQSVLHELTNNAPKEEPAAQVELPARQDAISEPVSIYPGQ